MGKKSIVWILIVLSTLNLGLFLFPRTNTCISPVELPRENVTKLVPSYFTQFKNNSLGDNKPEILGNTQQEQALLRNLSISITSSSTVDMNNVPTVPCLSLDGHLLVLSASASRIRYGVSVTFFMIHPTDLKNVLPKNNSAKPLYSTQLNLWCIFDDGSATSTYSYYYKDPYQDISVLDCPLSSFAIDQLWRRNRTLRVYLFSLTNEGLRIPILKAFVTVPNSAVALNSNRQLLTLCSSPLQDKAKYLPQWIEFHRLVGFQKFVIYNTSDKHQQLSSVVEAINKKYPHMVDVIQWNFASLNITDTFPTRYFQIPALQDCLIRYGDQSEWMAALDLDEYLVPLHPYETLAEYLYDKIGSRAIGSINLWSQFFCAIDDKNYTSEEKDQTRLVMERFTHRAKHRFKLGREKYLYRPRFVQYLTIHYQLVGLAKEESSEKDIMLAHYVMMDRLRPMPGCGIKEYVNDTSVRDRFAETVKKGLVKLD